MSIFLGSLFCRNLKPTLTRLMATDAQFKFLDLPNGKKLAYEKLEGSSKQPTVIYIPGFMSGKDGNKPAHFREYCKSKNYSYVRYDPICIGDSLGDWSTLEFEDWVENAGTVLKELGSDRNIVIGSSMGGWITLWLASQAQFKQKIESLIVIAPAVNFIRPYYAHVLKTLPKEAVEALDRGEIYQIQDESGMKPLKKAFAENCVKYEMDLSKAIEIECPVRMFHGHDDDTIPYKNSLHIMDMLKSENVELLYKKGSGHRFSDPDSLKLIEATLEKLMSES